MTKLTDILDHNITYSSIDDKDVLLFIRAVRKGIKFSFFNSLASKGPFKISEWSNFLHLSERTLQRYKKEKRTFDSLQSEKILQITLLFKLGIDVFGDTANFLAWLKSKNIALGGVTPKELLDSAFGINLIKDELTRIEHGILV